MLPWGPCFLSHCWLSGAMAVFLKPLCKRSSQSRFRPELGVATKVDSLLASAPVIHPPSPAAPSQQHSDMAVYASMHILWLIYHQP